MNIQIPSNLSNPKRILFVMMKQGGKLSSGNASKLVAAGVFKDKKAFSNAMYVLTKDNLVVKDAVKNIWVVTDECIAKINEMGIGFQPDAKLKTFNNVVDEYVESLYNINESLKKKIDDLANEADYWKKEYETLLSKAGELQNEVNELRNKLTSGTSDGNLTYSGLVNDGIRVINNILSYINR